MTNKPLWVMHVPVISTAHMPSSDALTKLSRTTLCANYDEGGFVYLVFDATDWTAPILKWLRTHFDDCANWVRFDCDADAIEGLPTYEWSST